ncbi:diadenylate cyclase [Priestia aryabhattai]|uniref:diadenylate cyclase n=1 Tax=Priestia aryabhattai TaxID=412384 RepID=UPI000BF08703|nr:diadenylate cyclase [Priestia aryabhattai]PEI51132.1 hypothetical protein CN635_25280 [Priestia aryabhattai]
MKEKSFTWEGEINEQEIKNFMSTLEEIVSGYLGFKVSFALEKDSEGGIKADAHVDFSVGVPEIAQNIGKEVLERVAFIINKSLNEYKKLDINVLYNIPRDLSLSFISDNYLDLPPSEQYEFIKTINALRDIGLETYESAPVNAGVIYCKNEKSLEKIKKSNGDFININAQKSISRFFLEEKPLLKLIDNKSLAIVIDHNYKVCGIIRKKPGEKSLSYMFESQYNERLINDFKNILFPFYEEVIERVEKESLEIKVPGETEEEVETFVREMQTVKEKLRGIANIETTNKCPEYIYFSLENKVVNIFTDQNFVISYSNGNWKLKHFNLMAATIMSLLFSQDMHFLLKTPKEECNMVFSYLNKGITNLLEIIKNISRNNSSSIFVIIYDDTYSKGFSLTENEAKEIMERNNFSDNNLERDFLNVIKKDGNHINIKDADNYLIETISAVDGAVIVDQYLNIVSLGEIINVPKEEVYSDTFGTGSKAARYASKAGIAIKISEDGYIYIYLKNELLLKI